MVVDEAITCFLRRLRGQREVFVVDLTLPSDKETNSAAETDEDSSSDGSNSSKAKRKREGRKKQKENIEKDSKERAAKVERLKKTIKMEGRRWKGFIYIHPATRETWVKIGSSLDPEGRTEGQHTSTYGPDLVVKMIEVDLGEMSSMSKSEAQTQLKRIELLIRVVLRKHHHHAKREVFPPSASLKENSEEFLRPLNLMHVTVILLGQGAVPL